MSERSLSGVNELAGAVANALMQSISTASSRTTSSRPGSSSGIHDHQQSSTASRFDLAANLRPASPKRPRFCPPTLFENARRSGCGRSGRDRRDVPKVVHYTRDIILLPPDCQDASGDIIVPRSDKRAVLGRAGLVGKIELSSAMSEEDVRKEICEVFSMPMGVSGDDLKTGNLFPFAYLQRAGSGARSLCLPSVKPNFEWNGKQVSLLAKSGAFIYLLARKELPGYQNMVSVDSYVPIELIRCMLCKLTS